MGKVIKIIRSFVSAVILLVIFLPVAVTLLLHMQSVQNLIVGQGLKMLSEKAQTEFSVEKVRFRLFNRLSLEGLYVEDYHGDTLFYARNVVVPLGSLNVFTGAVRLGDVELDGVRFNLMQDSSRTSNLKQILLKFKKEKKQKKKGFRLTASSATIRDMNFRHRKFDVRPKEYGVNFTDLDVRNFKLLVRNVSVADDSVNLAIDSLTLRERCGLHIENLSTRHFRISGSGMHFDDFRLKTAESDVRMAYLYFDYDTWKGYNDFLNKVNIRSEFTASTVSFQTIAYFAQGLRNWQTVFRNASGQVEGPVSNMRGSVGPVETRNTRVDVKFRMTGLPDVNRTHFSFDVQELRTEAADIADIVQDIARKSVGKNYATLEKMGRIAFTGHFDGLFSDFAADGRLQCELGSADLKLNIKPLQSTQRATGFDGTLNTNDFRIGSLLGIPKLDRIALKADVTGQLGSALRMKAQAQVPLLEYNGYAYNDIVLNGEFENKEYTGAIVSTDPNIAFDFDGKLNFNDSLPAYNFNLALHNADLYKLNFNRRDTVSVVRGNLTAQGSGIGLDELNGTIEIDDMTYINHIDTVKTGRIRMLADNHGNRKLLGFYSSFANAELKGRLSYNKMFSYFKNTLISYLPSISEHDGQERETIPPADGASSIDNYYLLNVNVKEANNVAGIFIPGLQVAQGTTLAFLFNPESDVFSLTLNSELIENEQFFVSNLKASARNQGDSISMFVTANDLLAKNLYMPNFSVIGGAKENRVNLAMRFNNTANGTYAMLSTTSALSVNPETGVPQIKINFYPSTLTTGNQTWRIGARQIVYDSTRVVVDNFRIENGPQRLSVNGTASRSNQDTLRLSLQHFDLKPLSQITSSRGYLFEGYTNGSADLIAAYGEGVLNADIDFDSIRVNQIPWRDTKFNCLWDFQSKRARFRLSDRKLGDNIVAGFYSPTERRYGAEMNIRKIDMALLAPVLKGVLRETQGEASARLTLSSRNLQPVLNGAIRVERFETTVDYTNVPYALTGGTIDVADNVMTLQPAELTDPRGNRAGFDMKFDFRNLRNLAYDIHVRPQNTLVLQTTEQQNDLFYGTIFASGNATIQGNKNGVNMNIVATTADNSHFYMPLGNSADISAADFIVFEDPRQKAIRDSLEKANSTNRLRQALARRMRRMDSLPSNMDIKMALNVKPNVEMQLTLDQAGDNLLKGRGNGTINLHVNPRNKDFTIYGDYDITDGSYRFSLKNFATRTFAIEDGSHIQWTGDPVNALVDITAVYKLKASLAPLLGAGEQNSRRNVPVDCIIRLSERLTQPAITFDVTVPNADPETQSVILNSMNTQEMMSTQFLWLLATQSFYADNSYTNQNLNIGAMGATVTGIDFLSNQLSSLLSTDRFRLAPKYRPKSEETSDEFGTEFYGELIKDKLIVEGDVSYDTGNGVQMNKRTANSLTGDVTLSLLLDEAGNFKVKAFTRTIDRFDENQGLQESGIGISYRQSFDTFADLIRNMRNRIERIRERKALKRQQKSKKNASAEPAGESGK